MTDILCFATQGTGSLDELRVRALLADLDVEVVPFDRGSKLESFRTLRRRLRNAPPRLVVMEGTGLAGGLALITLPRRLGVQYVVSSGDAIGPYLRGRHRASSLPAGLYERLLMRRSSGFVGWTPYLAGRAISLGAPRAMTAAGWARGRPDPDARTRWRSRLGIDSDAIVFGLVGSLTWRKASGYTYGLELVRAIRRTDAPVVVCVVGDGSGLERLSQEAKDELGGRILLPGRVDPADVANVLAAFDVGSLPQSVDASGGLRYGTKLPEYLTAGLPVVTGQLPLAYDLDEGWLWRLPGANPWSEIYVDAMAQLMATITREQIATRATAARAAAGNFDENTQRTRVTAFVRDLLA